MSLADAFAGLALRVGAAVGAPYWSGQLIDQATPGSYDDDGNFVPGSQPDRRTCRVQIDSADWAMRNGDGFTTGMMRFIVLSATLEGDIGTDARIAVLDGPYVGEWLVSAIERDPAAIGYVGRGKLA